MVWPEAQLAADIERMVDRARRDRCRGLRRRPHPAARYRLEAASPLTTVPLGPLHLPHGSLIVAVKRGGTRS